MKKIVALFTALAFALTLGVAFAEEKPAAPAAGEQKMEEKAPAKKKAAKKKKAVKKKEEAPAPAAAPAPAPAAPAGK
jgi:hypothetical protein